MWNRIHINYFTIYTFNYNDHEHISRSPINFYTTSDSGTFG